MSKWDAIESAAGLDEEQERFEEEFDADDVTEVSAEDIASAVAVGSEQSAGQVYDPPALKMADAANLRDIHPFLGYAWRELEGELKRDALVWLREWVDWFAITYKVDASLLPGCWFLHSEVIEYVWVAANAEVKSWHNPDASLTPFTSWHAYLPQLLQRLKEGSQTRCRGDKHVEDQSFGSDADPNAIKVNEAEWQRALNEVVDVQKKVSAGRWRAVAVESDGTLGISAEIEVPAKAESVLSLGKPVLGFDGEGNPMLQVRVSGADVAKSYWEYVDDDGQWVMDEFSVVRHGSE